MNVLIKEKESILKEKEAAVRLAQHLAYENDQLKEKQSMFLFFFFFFFFFGLFKAQTTNILMKLFK